MSKWENFNFKHLCIDVLSFDRKRQFFDKSCNAVGELQFVNINVHHTNNAVARVYYSTAKGQTINACFDPGSERRFEKSIN